MKIKQNKKQTNSVQDQIASNLFRIEEACSVLNEEFGIYTTSFDEAINEFFRSLENEEERAACRSWCKNNGFEVSTYEDNEF